MVQSSWSITFWVSALESPLSTDKKEATFSNIHFTSIKGHHMPFFFFFNFSVGLDFSREEGFSWLGPLKPQKDIVFFPTDIILNNIKSSYGRRLKIGCISVSFIYFTDAKYKNKILLISKPTTLFFQWIVFVIV